MIRRSALTLTLVFGLAGLVAGAATAQPHGPCKTTCTAQSSCEELCYVPFFVPDCPTCNLTTCGEYGVCAASFTVVNPCFTCGVLIIGTSGHDTLIGTSAGDCISGEAGNDMMYGAAANDCLIGGPGTDFADGGSGTDFCDGEVEVSCEL